MGLEIRRAFPARAIARTALGKMWIVLAALALGAKPRIALLHRLAIPIRIPTGQTLWLADVSELRMIGEVFVDRIYDMSLPATAMRILDLGANIGAASAFFADRYPGAEITAYEADPLVAARARKHLRGLPVEVHIGAISARPGTTTLRRATNASWATGAFIDDGEQFTTPAVPLDDAIGDGRVDILKIDIEGSEYAAIKASHRMKQVTLVIGEFHPVDGVTASDFFAALDGFDVLHGVERQSGPFVAVNRQIEAR